MKDTHYGVSRHMFKLSDYGLKPEEINTDAVSDFMSENYEKIGLVEEGARVVKELAQRVKVGGFGVLTSVAAFSCAMAGLPVLAIVPIGIWVAFSVRSFYLLGKFAVAKKNADAWLREEFIKAARTPKAEGTEDTDGNEESHSFH